MKRLLILGLMALFCFSGSLRAEGPDEKYIEIYKTIQEGNQFSSAGQTDLARERYLQAQADLKKIQAGYPNWNPKLVEFRLHYLESKLGGNQPAVAPGQVPAGSQRQPAPSAQAQPKPAPQTQPAPTQPSPVQPAPTPGPATPPKAQAEADDRDNQIKALQAQVGQLQSARAVLEAKLREALAAQPAAVDPRELAKAEERIKDLEKERAVLQVSLQTAEVKASQQKNTEAADLKKALTEARQKLTEQNDIIVALRQEKQVLEQRAQTAKRDDDLVTRLRTENDTLKMQLAERSQATPAPKPADEPARELAATKAALQSSRDSVASLQVRLRTLQEERDRLDKTRHDLETKLAAGPAASAANDAAQVRRLQKDNDDLQKKLTDTERQLADARSKSKAGRAQQPGDDTSSLRARLEVLEARKVPYTPEELALFKKPIEPAALTSLPPPKAPAKQLPADAVPLMAEAQRALAARRFDEAEKKLSEVLRMDAKNVETLQRLAAAQLEQNRPKDAEANLKRALEQRPTDARTLLLLGIADFDQDKFDDALDSLSRSAQADPQNPETQNYLGITLSQKGQRAAAETALRKAIQLSPNYSSAHYNLAVVYATQQPPFTELARWHYQKALAYGHPQNADFEKMIERKQASSQK